MFLLLRAVRRLRDPAFVYKDGHAELQKGYELMYFFLGHGRNSKGCMMILAERAFGHYYSTFEKSLDPSADVCGVGDCARLVLTLSDPRETSGPRIDRIPPARLTT